MYLMKQLNRTVNILVIICFCLSCCCCEATQNHLHNHENDNKERVADGPFSSGRRPGAAQQQRHYSGGEHHSEFDHEAVLGSKDAAEEFDRLPPEEAKTRLQLLAIKMDKNRDGKVEREELVQWILRSFKMLNKEDSDERHEESDLNGDGLVTWDEYVDENYGISPFDASKADSEEDLTQDKKMFLEDEELFAASDLDGDGKLNANEFLSFSHPEEFRYTLKILLRRTMDEKDIDRDGFLSFEEYLGEDAKGKDKEWHLVERDRFDYDYDGDRDGKLNATEVISWLTPDDRESAEQEADHLIESSDDDLDGSLTFREIADHHETFVGSEATDFGQHLQNPYKFKEEL